MPRLDPDAGGAGRRRGAWLVAAALVVASWVPALQPATAHAAAPIQAAQQPACGPGWVGAWAASPTTAEARGLRDQTLRMITNPTLSGTSVRLRFSNAFGRQPVTLGPVFVGRRADGAQVDEGSNVQVMFGGGRRSPCLPAPKWSPTPRRWR